MEENDSPWRIRLFKSNNEVSFKYPYEHIKGDDELRTFLNQSELKIDDSEKTRFLRVGDIVQSGGKKYKVDKIYLKLYDHELRKLSGSEIHILIGVVDI